MPDRSTADQAKAATAQAQGLRLIKSLLKFGRRRIGLDFDGSFEKIDPRAESANWLYVSKPHSIESVVKWRSKPRPFKFSWDKRKLKRSAAAYRGHGCDTYIFSAEGHGGGKCPITAAMLASSPARQGYVVIHEGWHSTLRKEKIHLPYEIEEATGRAIGCLGIIEFARETGNKELLEQAVSQERDWAAFAGFINRWHRRLSGLYADGGHTKGRKGEMLERAGAEAARLGKKMKTHWERKELEADLNNAFFLRYHDYTCFYQQAARLVKAAGSLAEAAVIFKKLQDNKNPVHAMKQLARRRPKSV